MRCIVLFITLFFCAFAFAQPYKEIETNNVRIDPDWVETFKSSGFCWAYDILVDDTGNTYSCGYFKNALIVGDSVLTSKNSSGGTGQESSFLIKRNTSGKLLWMLQIGGNNRPNSLKFGKDGSIILLGLQQAEYSYIIEPSGKETQLHREGNGRIFIARISTDGSLIKAVSLPNESPQYGHDIKEDSKGNWYIAGEENFRRPDRPSYVQNRFLLIKLNADWEIEWVQRGDTAQTSGFSSLVLIGKDIYTGGSYHQSLKIDQFQLDRKKQEQYPLLIKWNSNGKALWVRDELSTYPTGHVSNLVKDSKGNIYAWAGSSYSYAMLAKFDSNGEKLWTIEQKGKASVYTEKMLIDSKDRLYLCGQSYGNVFGSTNGETYSSKTKGGTDPYLASYSNEGVLLWIKVYGGKGTDYCKSIAINDSNLYSFGWTNTTMDFFNKQFTGRGYTFYTAKFQLKDLAFMDKTVHRQPLDTAEKWPKVNQQSCECESEPNAKIGYASTVKGLLSYERFQELTGWSVVGGDSIYNKLFYVNFQSSVGYSESIYSLRLISFKPILLESPGRTYRVELNSCYNQSRHRDLSLTLRYSEPSVSLNIDVDWLRLEVDGKIMHPWNPFTQSAELDSNGIVKPGSVLVSSSNFYFRNESGLQTKFKEVCMPRSEIGSTGILLDFDQIELIDPKNKHSGLHASDFPALAPKRKTLVPPTFDNPPPSGPILTNYSGLFIRKAKVLIPFVGQHLFCDAKQIAINNNFIAGTILIDATAELEGGSETGRVLVHLPEGDVYFTEREIEKIFLELGMDSVQCIANRHAVSVYFIYR